MWLRNILVGTRRLRRFIAGTGTCKVVVFGAHGIVAYSRFGVYLLVFERRCFGFAVRVLVFASWSML